MPLCPINPKMKVPNPCNSCSCHNHVPTLEYECLSLHCSIYNVKSQVVLRNLYGKGFQMQVALAIKASRVAWARKYLKPRKRKPGDFEKWWCKRIQSAGTLKPDVHWIDMVKENKDYLIADRMAQVLNTMDIQEFSLREICQEYKELFGSVDPVALAIPYSHQYELFDFLEEVQ